MDDPSKPARKRLRIFGGEETVQRGTPAADAPAENPYWSLEEIEPHPNPELGCVRRGLCCKSSPGWFAPGEVEEAAAFLGMEADAFVRKYLVIDGIDVEGLGHTEVFVPVKVGQDDAPLVQPGTRVDRLYRMFRSRCIFYDGHGCRIYGARPSECRRYICTNEPAANLSHEEIARMWRGEGE